VTAHWSAVKLLRTMAARGKRPAVIASGEDSVSVWDCETLAGVAQGLAWGLRERHVERGVPVALWAPNGPTWVAAALAILAAGGVLVPLDDLADPAQVDAAMELSGARLLFTTDGHAANRADVLRKRGVTAVLLDVSEVAAPAECWRALLRERDEPLPEPGGEDPAALLWTSGTTGSPKAFFLTHGNIGANVEALQGLNLVSGEDRALLPLPLHHAYPLIVGTLSTLTIGTPLVLPGGTTGPLLMKALRDGDVTTIVGVPRLYDAIVAAIEARVASRNSAVRVGWRTLLRLAILVQRKTGLRIGRMFFGSIRSGIAPRLRILVSGGARLERETAEKLEAMGWVVLSGYGLAETASLFTGNHPGERRMGSAGKPLAGGEIRIGNPDEQGIGEIELRGPSITKGYLNNPEATRSAFTEDGWFRTGDLGYVDQQGFLFVTGRAKEILVLGGGKKVNAEDLERVYGSAPGIREIAVLEERGSLVALVRADPAQLRARGATNVRDGARIVLAETAQRLHSYERLSGFALTDQTLPRTRLGKYRRFLLHDLYTQALAGGGRRVAHELGPDDRELLSDPTAAAIWTFLRGRYPDQAIDLDVNLNLDLNLDSLSWMELTMTLEERYGVHLSEQDVAEIETIRDLLRVGSERKKGREQRAREEPAIAEDLARWLAPTGAVLRAIAYALFALNWVLMHGLFRLRVEGRERLPATGPFVIAPNHVSDLDALAIAAALPLAAARNVYWAGDVFRLFFHPLTRLVCRIVHLYPVDEKHPDAAVAAATQVLQRGQIQVWFPEAWRSPDGRLQRFLPGIGKVLLRSGAPAVPAYIGGAFEALPRGRRIPKLRRITLIFGSAAAADALGSVGVGRTEEERIAFALRQRVIELAREGGFAVEGPDR
jgi:long-chain acyl-CoA synthetase